MTSITQASLRYVQELGTFLGPQNCTQGCCVMGPDWTLDITQSNQYISASPELFDKCNFCVAELRKSAETLSKLPL